MVAAAAVLVSPDNLACVVDAVCVGSFRDNDGYHGFLYSGGIYTTLNGPQTITLTHAQGINAAGQIVGWYANASGTHGFLYSGGRSGPRR